MIFCFQEIGIDHLAVFNDNCPYGEIDDSHSKPLFYEVIDQHSFWTQSNQIKWLCIFLMIFFLSLFFFSKYYH